MGISKSGQKKTKAGWSLARHAIPNIGSAEDSSVPRACKFNCDKI